MKLKLSYGRTILFTEFTKEDPVRLETVLRSIKESHPKIYASWCNDDEQIRDSLPVFVNGNHIRYKDGMETEVCDGDEVYIVPLITGG